MARTDLIHRTPPMECSKLWLRKLLISAFYFGMFASVLFARAARLRLIVPARQNVQERATTTMFVEEVSKRTSGSRAVVTSPLALAGIAPQEQVVVLAQRDVVSSLLPLDLRKEWQEALPALHVTSHPEAFRVLSLPWHNGRVVIIAGNDVRGELFGAGWLLRNIDYSRPLPALPATANFFTEPEKPVRGEQIGYRFKNNTYDAWTLSQFDQHIRDLAVFGNNTIQVISPSSDDEKESPLFHAPALDVFLGISHLCVKYGVDFDLYYPEMRNDYSDPAQVKAELRDFESLVSKTEHIDALYVPGGDPGHTAPELLLPLVEQQTVILHKYHPAASVWISAQGFDRERYKKFYELLNKKPSWLNGVFFGPQSRDSFETQRKEVPSRYLLQFYPDIAHVMHSQFPVPEWDPIFALTEGREPIDPRPQAFAEIYRHYADLDSGFVAYSEGVNDDVNKMLWSQLGWSSQTSVDTILSEYARYFLHREGSQNALAVYAIKGLEENWHGPLLDSQQIPKTLAALEELERIAVPPQTAKNWQWESLLYRGIYDDYVRRKRQRELKTETSALGVLEDIQLEPESRAARARQILDASAPDALEKNEHDRLFALGKRLFEDIGLQLSVKFYGASGWERGANLDRLDTPLNDAAWIKSAMETALRKANKADRDAALREIANWKQPSPGALYDDLGDPTNEPHLVRGESWSRDPELYKTAIDGIADRTLGSELLTGSTPFRLSWLDYAETLYETPLTLRYAALDPRRQYRLRVTYAGEDYALPLRLTANGSEVHRARLRKSNPETADFDLPRCIGPDGVLTLQWTGPVGSGGGGRGRQIAEVWLIPVDTP